MIFTVPIKVLGLDAKIPIQARNHDAGFDLYSTEDHNLVPGERHLFKLDIAIAIPPGYYGRISPRSGLALNYGLDVLAGIIDSGYRDNVGVLLVNLSDRDVMILKGDRIAQIIFQRCETVSFQLFDELPTSERGLGGFGSTG